MITVFVILGLIFSVFKISEGLGTALYIGGTLLAAGAGTYSAVEGARGQQKGRQQQRNAQAQAMSNAMRNEQKADADRMKIKQQQQLDIASLLAASGTGGRTTSGTMLTGPSGITTNSLLGG